MRNRTDIGRMDRKILVQRATETLDAVGGVVKTWSNIDNPWAEVVFLSGRELVNAQQKVAEVESKFVVWRSNLLSTLTPKDQIHFNELDYDILAVLPNPPGRPVTIEILAKRRADQLRILLFEDGESVLFESGYPVLMD